jgi:hypothetical protein
MQFSCALLLQQLPLLEALLLLLLTPWRPPLPTLGRTGRHYPLLLLPPVLQPPLLLLLLTP